LYRERDGERLKVPQERNKESCRREGKNRNVGNNNNNK
jgi:hypothetical protein